VICRDPPQRPREQTPSWNALVLTSFDDEHCGALQVGFTGLAGRVRLLLAGRQAVSGYDGAPRTVGIRLNAGALVVWEAV
jgi:hypothetical protein